MSLLIKALDKAQAEKAQAKGAAGKEKPVKSKSKKLTKSKSAKPEEPLSLEAIEKTPAGDKSLDDVPQALKGSAADMAQHADTLAKSAKTTVAENSETDTNIVQPAAAQKQAANVFTAKQAEPDNRKVALALIIGLLALVLIGIFAYWYQSVMHAPEIVIPTRPMANQEMPVQLAEEIVLTEVPPLDKPEMAETKVATVQPKPAELPAMSEPEPEPAQTVVKQEVVSVFDEPAAVETKAGANTAAEPAIEETLTENESVVETTKVLVQPAIQSQDVGIASESASIKVTKQKTESGENPILMRAYEAYNAGNDYQAQQDYKEVLKRYGPNVDAMLGLGAIAARQGRAADADDWYRKVLAVEPRNEVAKMGLLNTQQERLSANSESNIKSMLATAPDDSNLHAALGDLYANQGQWPAAQQAYFDAYRLNQSAENALNLAVSLDQLGKPRLALPYYQEALQKAEQSNVIDTLALEARISSIQ